MCATAKDNQGQHGKVNEEIAEDGGSERKPIVGESAASRRTDRESSDASRLRAVGGEKKAKFREEDGGKVVMRRELLIGGLFLLLSLSFL